MMMPLMLNPKADDAGDTCDADTMTTVNHHRHQSETPNLQLMKQRYGVPPDARRSRARPTAPIARAEAAASTIQLPAHLAART